MGGNLIVLRRAVTKRPKRANQAKVAERKQAVKEAERGKEGGVKKAMGEGTGLERRQGRQEASWEE